MYVYPDRVLTHGSRQLIDLANGCVLAEESPVSGWICDVWRLNDDDIQAAVDAYEAMLLGDTTDDIADLLAEDGIDLRSLLIGPDGGADKVTRSDVTEVIAAATLVHEGWEIEELHMPNIPKMSRRKSDSGLDVVGIVLDESEDLELTDVDYMVIASVKHTVHEKSASDLKNKLINSVTAEMTSAYMVTQLRVLNARLREEGMSLKRANRVYLFLRSFPDPKYVQLLAVAAIDPDLEKDLKNRIHSLPVVQEPSYIFRTLLVPELRTLHERCV